MMSNEGIESQGWPGSFRQGFVESKYGDVIPSNPAIHCAFG